MKPHVLVATQEREFRDQLPEKVADVCRVTFTPTASSLCAGLSRVDVEVVVLDLKLPDIDDLAIVRALRHVPAREPRLVTLGLPGHPHYFGGLATGGPVAIRRSLRAAAELLRAWFDPAASRTINAVTYQPRQKTFFLAFRDGKTYELPRTVIEADHGRGVVECRVVNKGDGFEVREDDGNIYDVAWDFVLYHQEPAYPHYRGKKAQQDAERHRALRIGRRVKEARERHQWSLGDLAKHTGIHAPNLSRLESGQHVPSLPTLERLADVLGLRVADLVAV